MEEGYDRLNTQGLVVMPGTPLVVSLLLAAMPGAPSSVLAPKINSLLNLKVSLDCLRGK